MDGFLRMGKSNSVNTAEMEKLHDCTHKSRGALLPNNRGCFLRRRRRSRHDLRVLLLRDLSDGKLVGGGIVGLQLEDLSPAAGWAFAAIVFVRQVLDEFQPGRVVEGRFIEIAEHFGVFQSSRIHRVTVSVRLH